MVIRLEVQWHEKMPIIFVGRSLEGHAPLFLVCEITYSKRG